MKLTDIILCYRDISVQNSIVFLIAKNIMQSQASLIRPEAILCNFPCFRFRYSVVAGRKKYIKKQDALRL